MEKKSVRHLLSTKDFGGVLPPIQQQEEIERLLRRIAWMEIHAKRGDWELRSLLRGKTVGILMCEESTRTAVSFQRAAQKLGADVFVMNDAKNQSSMAKGETLADTIMTLKRLGADIIVIRHPDAGVFQGLKSTTPVINAGDGTNEHPSQAILDLYTIWKRLGRLDLLDVVMANDLLHSRTISSLAYLLAHFRSNRVFFVSHPNLKARDEVKDYLNLRWIAWCETTNLADVPCADVIYQTRLQKNRLADPSKFRDKVICIEPRHISQLGVQLLLHPLPRDPEVGELPEILDALPQAAHFDQVENGLYTRMTLLADHLGVEIPEGDLSWVHDGK